MAPSLRAVVVATGRRRDEPGDAALSPMQPVCGTPIVVHVLEALQGAGVIHAVVVVSGGEAEGVAKRFDTGRFDLALDVVEQPIPRGSGDAVLAGVTSLPIDDEGDVIVVSGRLPLITAGLIDDVVDEHRATGNATTVLAPPDGGRGELIHVVRAGLLAPAIRRLAPSDPVEPYSFDGVSRVLADAGHPTSVLELDEPAELAPVVDRVALAGAEAELRGRINERWMRRGVTIVDPARTIVDTTVELAAEVTLFPGVMLSGRTVVGRGARLGPDVRLVDCAVGDGAVVETTQGVDAEIGPRAHVGPYAVLEPGAQVPAGGVTGPFYTARNTEVSEGDAT